jgi:hypothetical protein
MNLAQLWRKAFIDYKDVVGKKVKKEDCQLNTEDFVFPGTQIQFRTL